MKSSALKTCRIDPATGKSCAWYHGFWPILRALNIGTQPSDHRAFIGEALDRALAHGGANALIAGCADEAMLSEVARAFAQHGVTGKFTALDRCPTPLDACTAFAKRQGVELRCVVSDIFDYERNTQYDIIAVHSILGFIAPERRRELFKKWYALLAPGGTLITTNRIRPNETEDRVALNERRRTAFGDMVIAEAEAANVNWDMSAAQLREGAHLYAGGVNPWPVRSTAELRSYLDDAGFEIAGFRVEGVEGKHHRTAFGPTTPGGAQYALIHALRPRL